MLGGPRARESSGWLCGAGEGPRRKLGLESWGSRRPPRAARPLGKGRAVRGWTQPCSRSHPGEWQAPCTSRLRARHVTPRHPFSSPVSRENTGPGQRRNLPKGTGFTGGQVLDVAVYYLEAAKSRCRVWSRRAGHCPRDGVGKGSGPAAGSQGRPSQPSGRAHRSAPPPPPAPPHAPSEGGVQGGRVMEVRAVAKTGHGPLVLFLTRPGCLSGS